jgi:hypothetical protein
VYDAGGFVAHYQRVFWGYEAFNTAVSPEVDLDGLVLEVRLGLDAYVTSTDTDVGDADDHVVGIFN